MTPMSLSVATSTQPSMSGIADVTTTATMRPSALSLVRSRMTISAIVATPIAKV